MSFASTTIFDVQNGGSDTTNGGGFDPGNANFATDLAATSATGNSPVVTSASYNFVSPQDVGAWLYIKSGTLWTPGWYQIASCSGNAATLTATIGSAYLMGSNVPVGFNTVAGCATTASPSGGTWGIDYSQSTGPAITYTDMVIDATTNTKFTSVLNPVGKNLVGNTISVTSGSGFTVQTVQVASTSTITATCDKSLGTLSSTLGNGGVGGSVATLGQASKLVNGGASGHTTFIKYNATPYQAGTTANAAAGRWAPSFGSNIIGWNTSRLLNNADTLRPTIQASANAVTIITGAATGVQYYVNLILDGNTHTTCVGFNVQTGNLLRCKAMGLATGVTNSNLAVFADSCEANACTTVGFTSSVVFAAIRCTAIGCAIGFDISNATNCRLSYCVATGSTTAGFKLSNLTLVDHCTAQGTTAGSGFDLANFGQSVSNCLAYNNSVEGFHQSAANISQRLFNCAGGANSTNNYTSTFSAYQIENFVTLSADPFTAKGASPPDLSLNNTAGGGAACRGAGTATAPVGLAGASSPDIGAYQSGGTTLVHVINNIMNRYVEEES